jgi:hypothetical protein
MERMIFDALHGPALFSRRFRLVYRVADVSASAARETLAYRTEHIAALGGEAQLSPRRRKLVEMAVRGALPDYDAWLVGQPSLVSARTRALLPVLQQPQALTDRLARLLDRLGLDRIAQRV